MNDFIALVIMIIGGYLGWKILQAFFDGLTRAGEEVRYRLPEFFSKVIQSMAAGIIGGIIVGTSFGADSGIVGPSAVGIAGAVFIKEQFFA